MKTNINVMAFSVIALLLFLNTRIKAPIVDADKIYINGKVLTIDSSNTVAQAVAVKDGKILEVGTTNAIQKLKGKNTEVIDLGGKTLIPGFIDGHSHFMSFGRLNTANVAAPPVGPVKNIAGIITELQKFQKEKHIAKGEWITAFGY